MPLAEDIATRPLLTATEMTARLRLIVEAIREAPSYTDERSLRNVARHLIHSFVRANPGYLRSLRGRKPQAEIHAKQNYVSMFERGETGSMPVEACLELATVYAAFELEQHGVGLK